MSEDIQEQRAVQYAVCCYALMQGRIKDGAEAVFDQALTNGLAAIVAAEWPGDEFDKRRFVLAASGLLDVIVQHGTDGGPGVTHIRREGEPVWLPAFSGEEPTPNYTVIEVDVLRDALTIIHPVRHARDAFDADAPLGDEHIDALREFGYHPALFTADIAIDRAEERIHAADVIECERAAAYYLALDDEEQTRRQAINYEARFGYVGPEDRCEVEECPVCDNVALVARRFDGWLDEIGIGTCMVCSYSRSADLAEELATGRMMERHSDD